MFKQLFTALLILCISQSANAQIEIDRLSFKGFNAIGFGGFFNLAFPVTDADYITAELGLSAFSNNGSSVVTAPLLAGYRFTIDRSGTGFYLEPNAGYGFAATDIQLPNSQGIYSDAKISGAAAGLTFGYLFQPGGRIQFNLGIRYEHIFGSDFAPDIFSFRIAHAFTFGRRDSSY
ncbi:MAG TPA: hypothetical protein VMH27_16015 [Puia sp.]|nr:hypothetical protein [Puia sp.]